MRKFLLISLCLIFMFTTFATKSMSKSNELAIWEVPLTVTNGEATFNLSFGGDAAATDGFDAGLDTPAAPPGMTYYAYFEIAVFPNYLNSDIRAWVSPYDTEIDWTLKVVNATGKTTTITWDPTNLPAEGNFMLEGSNGSIDMRAQNSVTFSEDKMITIKYRYAPPGGTWSVPLSISGGDVSFTRTLGGSQNATDGYDIGLDVPAAPPAFDYYTYFEIAQFPTYLDKDIRAWISPYETDIDWTLKVVNATSKTTTITWNITNLPDEGSFTLEGSNGPVDMRAQNSLTFSEDKTIIIKYRYGTSVEFIVESQPTSFQLFQNYPNPFNPKTNISFQIPEITHVALKVFNILGHEIYTLLDREIQVGTYEFIWDGRNTKGTRVASGVYIYQLRAGDFLESKKMILMQ